MINDECNETTYNAINASHFNKLKYKISKYASTKQDVKATPDILCMTAII